MLCARALFNLDDHRRSGPFGYGRPAESFERVPSPAVVDRLLGRIAHKVQQQASSAALVFSAFDENGAYRPLLLLIDAAVALLFSP